MRIIIKKGYFYLQHSFRKDGKVITEEKYLGKEVPKDISKIRIVLEEKAKQELYNKLEKIKNKFKREWAKYPETVKNKILEELAIAFTYNTNAIEGSTITLYEAKEILHDKIAPNKPLREIKETEKHFRVFLNILNKRDKLTNDLLLKWHKEIFGETKSDISGKYRDYTVKVGDYRAPDWQDIRNLMDKLIAFINKSNINPVELSARAHYKFEKIHPFGDGNGRIGRLLINYILWHNKYPMLIIEYKKRRSYYKALQKDEEGFVHYFIRRYLAVHKNR